jgi:catechol 2,3-dioxygenase-like lactoylglutathione lyase family enzyme
VAFDFDGLCSLVQVFDMPTSVKFYGEVLGFELVDNLPVVHSPKATTSIGPCCVGAATRWPPGREPGITSIFRWI